jgi:hypothetical protein
MNNETIEFICLFGFLAVVAICYTVAYIKTH